jgi:zinc transporter ZupT
VFAKGDWEWAGTVSLTKSLPYTWVMAMNNGSYADSSMKVAIIETDDLDAHGIEEKEEKAKSLFNGTAIEVTARSTTELSAGVLYNLKVNAESFLSTYIIHVDKTSPYAVFTEHAPTEFEDKYHCLKDPKGADVEFVATEKHEGNDAHAGHKDHDEDHNGHDHGDAHDGHDHGDDHDEHASVNKGAPVETAFAASLIVALSAFFGLITLVPFASNYVGATSAAAFGSGALLGCALFLMWPESLYLIPCDMSTPSEADIAGAFGACVLAGFITSTLVNWATILITGVPSSHSHSNSKHDVVPSNTAEKALEGGYEKKAGLPVESIDVTVVDWSLITTIALGDGFHNLVDGVVIGSAFRMCSSSKAWAVAAATIGHELTQELTDFLIMTKQGGLTTKKALAVNFASACFCILGTLIVYGIDPNGSVLGCLLAYGGGTYM